MYRCRDGMSQLKSPKSIGTKFVGKTLQIALKVRTKQRNVPFEQKLSCMDSNLGKPPQTAYVRFPHSLLNHSGLFEQRSLY